MIVKTDNAKWKGAGDGASPTPISGLVLMPGLQSQERDTSPRK